MKKSEVKLEVSDRVQRKPGKKKGVGKFTPRRPRKPGETREAKDRL